ncbi:Lsr2 family protein [Microbacterium sp. KSW2-29]|uniref:Lsr2 family protein n=1 Tax=Microbacterium phycohabitans TaxID=3075993 RepID=A0ABU3SP52_9MICO|nr:Lsr2 family protein [Microbacterium sp. KSW2-29]MDU0346593.1 Lsr2 family protein [Microbacterium sp. KSW2-29]
MAKKHITQVIDDLDGSVIDDGETVHFSLEGRSYEIDLSSENVEKMREAFEPFISAGRPVGFSSPSVRKDSRRRPAPTRDLVDVRTWAEKNGYSINARGRISAAVLAAYDAAH